MRRSLILRPEQIQLELGISWSFVLGMPLILLIQAALFKLAAFFNAVSAKRCDGKSNLGCKIFRKYDILLWVLQR